MTSILFLIRDSFSTSISILMSNRFFVFVSISMRAQNEIALLIVLYSTVSDTVNELLFTMAWHTGMA